MSRAPRPSRAGRCILSPRISIVLIPSTRSSTHGLPTFSTTLPTGTAVWRESETAGISICSRGIGCAKPVLAVASVSCITTSAEADEEALGLVTAALWRAHSLAYKGWKKCIPAGLRLAAECLDGCDPDKLRLARSARHSKFPECTSCQEKKKRFMDVMNDPAASPAARQEAYDDLEQHMKEWTSDRKVALSMKYESFGNDSNQRPVVWTQRWCHTKLGHEPHV